MDEYSFTLTRKDYDTLLLMLGFAGAVQTLGFPILVPSFLRLANEINKNNPQWKAYEIPADTATANDESLVRWIYGILHDEPEPSGSFLRALAEAAARADPENAAILQPALWAIMARFPKYQCTCGRPRQK